MWLLKNERGYAIISAISMLMIVSFLSIMLFVLAEKELNLSYHDALLFDLKNEAESSLILAISKIRENEGNNPLVEKLKKEPNEAIFLFAKEQEKMGITSKVYGKQKGEQVIFLVIAKKEEKNTATRLVLYLRKDKDKYKIERWEH